MGINDCAVKIMINQWLQTALHLMMESDTRYSCNWFKKIPLFDRGRNTKYSNVTKKHQRRKLHIEQKSAESECMKSDSSVSLEVMKWKRRFFYYYQTWNTFWLLFVKTLLEVWIYSLA